MKNLAKTASLLTYIVILSILLQFRLSELFDFKQFCLVLAGMFLLFFPGFSRGETRQNYAGQLASCALYASYIQTFILLFLLLSTEVTQAHLFREVALRCRPILYGICLWVIFSIEPEKTPESRTVPDSGPAKSPAPEMPEERKYKTASETYEAYRRLGLTNRESELALLIEKGKSNSEIAAELNISETTVKKHISNIFEKLKISRREQIREQLRQTASNSQPDVLK